MRLSSVYSVLLFYILHLIFDETVIIETDRIFNYAYKTF